MKKNQIIFILFLIFITQLINPAPNMKKLVHSTTHSVLLILSGGIIAGEAAALYAYMYLNNNSDYNPWFNMKNSSLIMFDMIYSSGLVFNGIVEIIGNNTIKDFRKSRLFIVNTILFYIFNYIGLISHIARDVEFFSNDVYAFCFNFPLFIVNNLKMGLLITNYILGISLCIKIGKTSKIN